jgi:serine/threonine protein kinase
MSAPRPELVGLLLEGRYELRHVLGAGGFATVYLALDRRLHEREVAIKVLHPEHLTSADQVVRFAREIKVAARIGAGCEHLVKITDHGRCAAPALLYFVMEYLAGPSLRQVLTDVAASALGGRRVQRPLPWQRAVTLTLQLCAAMTALHRHGVVHRDIKPENLIVETSGVGDLLKLLDYGIAELVPGAAISGDGPRAALRPVLGTPRYMAPEQLHEDECDHRVDIHAAGAILGEMLTGEPPPRPGAAPLAAEHRPDLPPALAELVLRATARDPAARFASADEFSAALVSVLRDAAAATAADEATTLASVRSPTPGARPDPHADERAPPARPRADAPRRSPDRAARSVANPAARDRLLLWLGRLASATFLTTSTLGALALVFALFTVVRHARSQSPGPADRLVREDIDRVRDQDLVARAGPLQPSTTGSPSVPSPTTASTPAALPVSPTAPTPASPTAPTPASPTAPTPASPTAPTPVSPTAPTPASPTAPTPASPTAPAPSPATSPPAGPPAPSRTIEQIVRAAERKIRARCGSRGGDRMVEYTIVFAAGSRRVAGVRVEGEHQGRELGDCVETAALKIDFGGARDRVTALPRALYRM